MKYIDEAVKTIEKRNTELNRKCSECGINIWKKEKMEYNVHRPECKKDPYFFAQD